LSAPFQFDGLNPLASLRGLRTAPILDPDQRQRLRSELSARLAACQWFTVGVMAPDREAALSCLRSLEASLGWSPLREEGDVDGSAAETGEGPVFLKGNQRNGGFRLRQEAGLGEGLLITGHNPEVPDAEDTWGPLPLDLFA
jgi:Domain of unknown function (DUF1824)